MTTLRSLTERLGTDLAPCGQIPDPEVEVTGVHISELADPTAYLSGGELLLTTGLPLYGRLRRAPGYARRLADRGVCGLGFGIGPVFDAVPSALAAACERAAIPLFAVPGPTPFQVITRAFWGLQTAARRAELTASLDGYRRLIAALRHRRPTSAVVGVLASAVDGWSAHLAVDGSVTAVAPRSALPSARRLAEEVAGLRGAGPQASATLPLDDADVVVQPVSSRGRQRGVLAVASPGPVAVPARQLLLAACALLGLEGDRRQDAVARSSAERGCVLTLLLGGHLDAARALADELGQPRWPAQVRLIGVAGASAQVGRDLGERAERRAAGGPVWVAATADHLWVLTGPDGAGGVLDDVRSYAGSGMRAQAGPLCRPDALPRWRAVLLAAMARSAPGQVVDGANGPAALAAAQMAALSDYPRSDLIAAVAAYLRHRGHWDRASADLGVHRNTLRQRIERAATVAGVDLDDMDQASHLWLALRDGGAPGPAVMDEASTISPDPVGAAHTPGPGHPIGSRTSTP